MRNLEAGVEGVAECFRPLLDDRAGTEAMAILRRDFLDHDGIGPRRAVLKSGIFVARLLNMTKNWQNIDISC